ncbi:MAG TPA: DUF1559 domain-containing protein [Pirellulales bacterium]|jgi:prepilin-type processing-associated H-X9-DG protein/prepilin-type N-terminal cleavage/methylation domain-containing protein
MRPFQARLSGAFTLIEVLLVVAIIALLVTLSIPAIQSAREAARRTQCTNNMKQYGVAFAGFEGQQKMFPAALTGRLTGPISRDATVELYGYMADLMPFLDAQSASAAYHRKAVFCAAENASAIRTVLPVAICPSAPDRDLVVTATFVPSLSVSQSVRDFPLLSGVWSTLDKKYTATYEAGISDYAIPLEAAKGLAQRFGYEFSKDSFIGLQSMFPVPIGTVPEAITTLSPLLVGSTTVELKKQTKASDITDGLSHTFALTEVAGRPQRWQNGSWTGLNEPLNAAWADPRTVLQINGVPGPDGNPCLLQCDNSTEIYSFHPAGVNFLFADGHVQTVPAGTDPRVILAWLSPNQADAAP